MTEQLSWKAESKEVQGGRLCAGVSGQLKVQYVRTGEPSKVILKNSV